MHFFFLTSYFEILYKLSYYDFGDSLHLILRFSVVSYLRFSISYFEILNILF